LGKRIKGKNVFVVFEDWDIKNRKSVAKRGYKCFVKNKPKSKTYKKKIIGTVQHKLHWLLESTSYFFHLMIVFWLFVMRLVLFYRLYLRSGILDVV
jgi:hypothetical protein